MSKKRTSIPVNYFVDEFNSGISIEKTTIKDLVNFNEANQAHRHDCHSLMLLETGKVTIEIDFKKYKIKALSIIYMHPNQVHRTSAFQNVCVWSLAITNENLKPEYLKLLEEITPAKPLALNRQTFSVLSEALRLCVKLSERTGGKLYHSLLKDACNTFTALVVSLYLEGSKAAERLSRVETITKAFNKMLEDNYTTVKRPTDYAKMLNISTPYLNECIKSASGYSVSYHIQQRVILEAKRLLYHSDKSVKEIATELGYDDYQYFSRLFTKVSSMPPLTFRNKHLD